MKDDLEHIVDHTTPVWESMRGSRVFITGGTGFFGRWLLESLCYANDRLNAQVDAVVLTRDPQGFAHSAPHIANHSSVGLHAGDVRTFNSPGGVFTHVMHVATPANAVLNFEQPTLMLDTIIEGTRHTLDFAVASRASRFLNTSSGAVYGRQPSNMAQMSEDYGGAPDTTNPSSAIGEGKRVAELLSTFYSRSHGFEAISARCFTFAGPHLPIDMHFAIGNFIRDGLQGRDIVVNGDGTPYRSYLYAADLAIWLWTLLCRGKSCHVYNVGSDDSVQIGDVAHAVSRAFNGKPKVDFKNKPVPGQPVEQYVPSIQRARTELGLQPWIGLDEAIRRTVSWNC